LRTQRRATSCRSPPPAAAPERSGAAYTRPPSLGAKASPRGRPSRRSRSACPLPS